MTCRDYFEWTTNENQQPCTIKCQLKIYRKKIVTPPSPLPQEDSMQSFCCDHKSKLFEKVLHLYLKQRLWNDKNVIKGVDMAGNTQSMQFPMSSVC